MGKFWSGLGNRNLIGSRDEVQLGRLFELYSHLAVYFFLILWNEEKGNSFKCKIDLKLINYASLICFFFSSDFLIG